MKNTAVLFLILSFFANAQDKKAYQLFDKEGNKTSYKKLIKAATATDVVLFGEYQMQPRYMLREL